MTLALLFAFSFSTSGLFIGTELVCVKACMCFFPICRFDTASTYMKSWTIFREGFPSPDHKVITHFSLLVLARLHVLFLVTDLLGVCPAVYHVNQGPSVNEVCVALPGSAVLLKLLHGGDVLLTF